jgi:hypothetical protein
MLAHRGKRGTGCPAPGGRERKFLRRKVGKKFDARARGAFRVLDENSAERDVIDIARRSE